MELIEKGKKMALFSNGKQVSQFWKYVFEFGTEYYIAERKDGKQAIFHIDNKEEPISEWWDMVYAVGLVKGQSPYYIAEKDRKFAIFHKDNKDKPISGWCDWIYSMGFLEGESYYFIAGNGEISAIYNKDGMVYELTLQD